MMAMILSTSTDYAVLKPGSLMITGAVVYSDSVKWEA